jgi:Na+/melibiose symporter-like transporter|tara:strand:+ start:114 stop:620 length:507 start_codon:yes stop_codon:yes gene_type:complete
VLVEKRSSEVFLRPRFSIELQEDHQTVLARFQNKFAAKNFNLRGNITDNHVFISIPKAKDHFWSPQLHLEVIKSTEKTTTLKGLFGPKSQVWTMFMFLHFVIGVSFLGFLVMLYSKISLEEPLVFPIIMLIFLPILWLILYFLGSLGKDIGKKQMKELHNFMIEIIED